MSDRQLLQQCYDMMKVLYIHDLSLMRALKVRLEQQGEWQTNEFGDSVWVEKTEQPKVYTDVDEMFKDMGIPQQSEQEPVAWADRYDLDREGHDFWVSRQANVRTSIPLYTAPPQRKWRGLTDEEVIWTTAPIDVRRGGWILDLSRAIEAKLKEKNSG